MPDTDHSNPDVPPPLSRPRIPSPPVDPRQFPLDDRRDGLPHVPSHLQGWAAVLLAAAALVGSIGGVITGVVSIVMQDKSADRQVEIKQDLEQKAADERQAKIINLLGTWKYLESIADDTGKPKDKENSEKARLEYEKFKALSNGH